MAIQKEIWMAAIVEGLFASNSFLSKAFNADEYVNNGKLFTFRMPVQHPEPRKTEPNFPLR